MQGKRRADGTPTEKLLPGEYAKIINGDWHPTPFWVARTPVGTAITLGRHNHAVEEHEDGTISVTPSIAPAENHKGYHGYLRHGVWGNDLGDRS